MDELIDDQLESLRAPVEPAHRMGEAILAMRAAPKATFWQRFRLPVGVGSGLLVVGAIVVFSILAPGRAMARELEAIGDATAKQKTMHKVTTFFDDAGKAPIMVMDVWIDRKKQAYRQYNGGFLFVTRVSDGERTYHYSPATKGMSRVATVEDGNTASPFRVVNLAEIFRMPFYRTHRVEKRPGTLNGKPCDFFWIADGFYRLWVDRDTKLPLQGEIYDRGKVLSKRDVYEYPAKVDGKVFEPVRIPGMVYGERKPSPPGPPQKASASGR